MQPKLYVVSNSPSKVMTFNTESNVEQSSKEYVGLKSDISEKYNKTGRSGKVNKTGNKRSSIMTNSNFSREELDVKLELIEERLDRKVERIETSITQMTSNIRLSIDTLNEEAQSVRNLRTEISSEIKSQRIWNIGTALALLLGIAALFQWSGSILHTNTLEVSKAITSANDLKIELLIKDQEQTKNQLIEIKNLLVKSKQ